MLLCSCFLLKVNSDRWAFDSVGPGQWMSCREVCGRGPPWQGETQGWETCCKNRQAATKFGVRCSVLFNGILRFMVINMQTFWMSCTTRRCCTMSISKYHYSQSTEWSIVQSAASAISAGNCLATFVGGSPGQGWYHFSIKQQKCWYHPRFGSDHFPL